jgi:23S rRNA pseudouridine1911/1915/1917 synthase
VAKPNYIELGTGEKLRILYEDRSVIAIDKPPGWMLIPFNWQNTGRNLQAAVTSAIAEGQFWARSRNLRYLQHVHRLDAETSGVLLFARSTGALHTFSELFESRKMHKRYLAVVQGVPAKKEWTCDLKLAPDPAQIGRMRVDAKTGKVAETHFCLLQTRSDQSLVEAMPITGRTHQIRLHLAAEGFPVSGDPFYGPQGKPPARVERNAPLGLRAVQLEYRDPFTRKPVRIQAPPEPFLAKFGFEPPPV